MFWPLDGTLTIWHWQPGLTQSHSQLAASPGESDGTSKVGNICRATIPLWGSSWCSDQLTAHSTSDIVAWPHDKVTARSPLFRGEPRHLQGWQHLPCHHIALVRRHHMLHADQRPTSGLVHTEVMTQEKFNVNHLAELLSCCYVW
jgi:hypothetical protein